MHVVETDIIRDAGLIQGEEICFLSAPGAAWRPIEAAVLPAGARPVPGHRLWTNGHQSILVPEGARIRHL